MIFLVSKKGVKAIVLIMVVLLAVNTIVIADSKIQPVVTAPTIVGTGEFGCGDGSAAEAVFGFPHGIAYSKKSDALIIADTQNHRICSLSLKTLKVTTIAGIGKGVDRFGFPGGGYVDGDVKKAMFNRPKGIAVAESGAIIVADAGNHAIRQIYDGKVTTIAGGKVVGYQDGKGTKASFENPSGIAIHEKGIIFVSDTMNNMIRKIDIFGNVTTYAGRKSDNSILSEPVGLTVDKEGILYVTDSGNHQIKKVTAKDKVETVAGMHLTKDAESGYWVGGYIDGDISKSYFNFPKGIAVKDDGTIFVADTYNYVLRIIKDSSVSTVAGAGVAGDKFDDKYISYFDGPIGIVYAKGTLFIADQWNNRIVLIPDKDNYLMPIDTTEAVVDKILTFIDNKEIVFPDVNPLFIEGELKVPIRAIAEAWGAEVIWNQEKKSVSLIKDEKAIELYLETGDFLIYEGRSLVDLEFLKNMLGLKLKWVGEQNIISIESE